MFNHKACLATVFRTIKDVGNTTFDFAASCVGPGINLVSNGDPLCAMADVGGRH